MLRERSPIRIRRLSNSSNSSESSEEINILSGRNNFLVAQMANFTEINIAKEIIPHYEGGSKNLSHFIQQCEKFIDNYRDATPGQESCSLNRLLFELCCSRVHGAARDTLVISTCATWTDVKNALVNRFGDPRNETLLADDLATCFQNSVESYEQYYERIKAKLQFLLEHVSLREPDVNLRNFKINNYKQRALQTYMAGLLEPYRSHIALKTVNSLEECLLQLRSYDNHQQQVSFLNFMRNKGNPQKNVNIPQKNYQQNSLRPTKSNSSQGYQFNKQYQNPMISTYRAHVPTFHSTGNANAANAAYSSQTKPTQQFNNNFKPTPMSVTTNNTSKPTPMSISYSNNTNKFPNNSNQRNFNSFIRKPNFQNSQLHNVTEDINIDDTSIDPFQPDQYCDDNENVYGNYYEESDEHDPVNFTMQASEDQ